MLISHTTYCCTKCTTVEYFHAHQNDMPKVPRKMPWCRQSSLIVPVTPETLGTKQSNNSPNNSVLRLFTHSILVHLLHKHFKYLFYFQIKRKIWPKTKCKNTAIKIPCSLKPNIYIYDPQYGPLCPPSHKMIIFVPLY